MKDNDVHSTVLFLKVIMQTVVDYTHDKEQVIF